MTASWPGASEYAVAIQSPDISFDDGVLRRCSVENSANGLPRPVSGSFGVVYHLIGSSGNYAVKCFFKRYDDQRDRFARVSDFLQKDRTPYTVDFRYLSKGIRVNSSWYPILSMDWMKGQSLCSWAEAQRHSPQELRSMACQFRKMMENLHKRKIAHGDLQGPNILVVNGELKLIDYDGMFVPALRGYPGYEVGQPNYQHPRRDATHFGEGMDSFSSWVIYISLVALAVTPSLWTTYDGGGDHLLFTKMDFLDPANSDLFRDLGKSPDRTVRELAKRLAEFARQKTPPREPLPDLSAEEVNAGSKDTDIEVAYGATGGITVKRGSGGVLPSWMTASVLVAGANGDVTRDHQARTGLAWPHLDAFDWQLMQPEALPKSEFASTVRRVRFMTLFLICVAGAACALGMASVISWFIACWTAAACVTVAAVEITVSYATSPEYRHSAQAWSELKNLRDNRKLTQQKLDELETASKGLLEEETKGLEALKRQCADGARRERERTASMLRALEQQRDGIPGEVDQLTSEEEQWKLGQERTIEGYRVGRVFHLLELHFVEDGRSSHVSDESIDLLVRSGIRSAADLTSVGLAQGGTAGGGVVCETGSGHRLTFPSLSATQANAIRRWWLQSQREASDAASREFPPSCTAAQRQFEDRRQELRSKDGRLQSQIQSAQSELQRALDRLQRTYDEQVGVLRQSMDQRFDALAAQKSKLDGEGRLLNQALRKAYTEVNVASRVDFRHFMNCLVGLPHE